METQKTYKWEQVLNPDGERSRGLWKRGESFYVQCNTLDPQTSKIEVRRHRLDGARTEPQARKMAEAIKIKAENGELYKVTGSPYLGEYIPHYLANCHKSEITKKNEKIYLNRWLDWLGNVRLSTINTAQILSYRTHYRQTLSAHSVNVQVYALKSLLKLAKQEGKLEELPTQGIIRLKHKNKKKELLSPEQIDLIISTAIKECPRTGKQFSDYVKLCCYSGGRQQEVLNLQWSHIHFDKELIEFSDSTKFDKTRFVNLNSKLKAHLLDMQSRRKQDNPYLFPSFRTGKPITSFQTTGEAIAEKLNIDFSDHSFRHYFASMCVMGGLDFMTIAKWLGHADGGLLVGKTYGHLNNQHLKDAASKLSL
jgi:integrase